MADTKDRTRAFVADQLRHVDSRKRMVEAWRKVLAEGGEPAACVEFVAGRMAEALDATGLFAEDLPAAPNRAARHVRDYFEDQLSQWCGHLLGTLVELWHATNPSADRR